jgi:Protein of unknown function (DUF3567)
MHMLYNSDNYVVMQFDVPTADALSSGAADGSTPEGDMLTRGGYEIVDKFARREIFIEGAMAQSFKEGVQALIETSPSQDEMDDYLGRYASLMQQPVILH